MRWSDTKPTLPAEQAARWVLHPTSLRDETLGLQLERDGTVTLLAGQRVVAVDGETWLARPCRYGLAEPLPLVLLPTGVLLSQRPSPSGRVYIIRTLLLERAASDFAVWHYLPAARCWAATIWD